MEPNHTTTVLEIAIKSPGLQYDWIVIVQRLDYANYSKYVVTDRNGENTPEETVDYDFYDAYGAALRAVASVAEIIATMEEL